MRQRPRKRKQAAADRSGRAGGGYRPGRATTVRIRAPGTRLYAIIPAVNALSEYMREQAAAHRATAAANPDDARYAQSA